MLLGKHNKTPNPARLNGYRTFLAQMGLPLEENLVVAVPFEHRGGFEGMQRLLSLELPPTAVLAANDIIAIGALHAVTSAGKRVPQDVSIMGMDDIYAAATIIPPLTTMAKQKYEIGCRAATFLLERIRDQYTGEARHLAVPCQLVVRNSTAELLNR